MSHHSAKGAAAYDSFLPGYHAGNPEQNKEQHIPEEKRAVKIYNNYFINSIKVAKLQRENFHAKPQRMQRRKALITTYELRTVRSVEIENLSLGSPIAL